MILFNEVGLYLYYLVCYHAQSMRVSHSLLQTQTALAFLPKDSNYNFLIQISYYPKEKRKIDFQRLKERIDAIRSNIQMLEIQQRQEWQSNLLNKANILLKQYNKAYNKVLNQIQSAEVLGRQINALRECFYTVVFVCVIEQIEYDVVRMEAMIKQFYFKEYGEEIIAYLESVDYDISTVATLFHKKSRVPYHCCKQKIDKDVQILD